MTPITVPTMKISRSEQYEIVQRLYELEKRPAFRDLLYKSLLLLGDLVLAELSYLVMVIHNPLVDDPVSERCVTAASQVDTLTRKWDRVWSLLWKWQIEDCDRYRSLDLLPRG